MTLGREIVGLLRGTVPAAKLLTLIVVFFVAQALAPGNLLSLALVPREVPGLIGVVFAPLLHANLAHLLGNLGALLVLLAAVFSDEHYSPRAAVAAIWIGGGLGTWVIGRPDPHLGASGLVFGLIVYLVTSSLFLRSWRAMLVALFVIVQYGAVLATVIPTEVRISWESHLCGALAGACAAFVELSSASARTKIAALATACVVAGAAAIA